MPDSNLRLLEHSGHVRYQWAITSLLQGCLSDLKLRGREVSLVGKGDPLIDRAENLGECSAHPCAELRYYRGSADLSKIYKTPYPLLIIFFPLPGKCRHLLFNALALPYFHSSFILPCVLQFAFIFPLSLFFSYCHLRIFFSQVISANNIEGGGG
jgi:hypothetical protein